MRRRDFVRAIVGSATAWPLAARAQQPDRVRRIGVLMGYPDTDAEAQSYFAAFRESLRRLGWIEGRNISIEIRWARPGDMISMERFAKELIAVQPDLILSNTTPTTVALLQQTRSIPLVFAMVADPIGSGFVTSFAQPGGNATGFVTTEATLGGKWVDLLKEIAPNVVKMAMLFNPATAIYGDFWSVQSCGCITFNGGDRSTGSRRIQPRSCNCHAGT